MAPKRKRKYDPSTETKIKQNCKGKNERSELLILEKLYGIKMPKSLFHFWDYCITINSKTPLKALPYFRLVGPFEVLNNLDKFKTDFEEPSLKHLLHYRFYFDPPEMLTVVVSEKSDYHLGLFHDDPKDETCLVVSNNGKNCMLNILGDNLFHAVAESLSELSFNEHSSVINKLRKYAEGHDLSLKNDSAIVRERKRKINAKCFHQAGMVVPIIDGNGYRELFHTYSALRKIFDNIEKAPNDDLRTQIFEEVQEIITCVQFANDECDYGMGMELGINMFCHGSRYLNKASSRLLTVAYELMERKLYSDIIKEHLADRRKTNLSRL